MSAVVYALPYVPPRPPVDVWRGVSMRYEAPDGSVWPLADGRPSGVRMRQGMRGLTWPEREAFVDETAGAAGGRWRGQRDLPGEVFWPISVWRDGGSAAWLEHDAAWWRALDTEDEPGRWVVTHPNGSERWLGVRFVSDGQPAWDHMPGMRSWAQYGVRGVATDPYWRGASATFGPWSGAPAEDESFFGAGGPPFTISEGGTGASAQVRNDGDVTAFLQWRVRDVLEATLTVGGRSVFVPAVAADRLLVIDSGPGSPSALEIAAPPNGLDRAAVDAWIAQRLPTATDRTIQLGYETLWGSVPKRSVAPLDVELVGAGNVSAAVTPRYRRAW